MPLISGFVGYITNVIALKMTFYPLEFWPLKVGAYSAFALRERWLAHDSAECRCGRIGRRRLPPRPPKSSAMAASSPPHPMPPSYHHRHARH